MVLPPVWRVQEAVLPLRPKCPRSVFVNRDASPLVLISRRIAAYSVACGVFPPGLVQYPFADIASIIAFEVIGSPDSPRTFAAASSALILPSAFAAGLAFGSATGFFAFPLVLVGGVVAGTVVVAASVASASRIPASSHSAYGKHGGKEFFTSQAAADFITQ